MAEKVRPLQKAPLALLGALDLKVLGQNPDTFPPELQAVYDSVEHYLVDKQTVITASGNAQAQGTEASFTVPFGFAYRMKTLNVALTFANVGDKASDGISIRGGIRMPDGTGVVLCAKEFMAQAPFILGLALDRFVVDAIYSGPPILLPAGSKIFVQLGCGLDQQEVIALSALVQTLPT